MGILYSTGSRVGESVTLVAICNGVCRMIWVCYIVQAVGLVTLVVICSGVRAYMFLPQM